MMYRSSSVFKVNKYFIPYVIFLIIVGYKGQITYAFFIVVMHEMVHYITARHYGFTGFDIELMAVGAVLKFRDLDDATPKEDLIISISGPVSNIALAVIFYFIYRNSLNSNMYMLFAGNFSIGVFNLIPAFPLDGGRILRDLLNFKFTYKKSNKIMIIVSIIIGIFLIFCCMLLFFRVSTNFTIGIIGIFIIVASLKENERISYIIMGNIVKKKYKLTKNGYMENKSISIYCKKSLLYAMGLLDKNKYNIFTVLDEELKVIDIIYEEEIINALKLYGNITIEEFIKIEYDNR
jgi:stage IV sporulation protein FB